jgi:hypothetical protein
MVASIRNEIRLINTTDSPHLTLTTGAKSVSETADTNSIVARLFAREDFATGFLFMGLLHDAVGKR